mgnify:CR=1 FL=1
MTMLYKREKYLKKIRPFYDSDDERWSLVEKKIESFDCFDICFLYNIS